MKIILFGSTDATLSVATFLLKTPYKIGAIVTTPETFSISYKPEGVKNSRFVDMNIWGTNHGIPVVIYKDTEQAISDLKSLGIELGFALVVGWFHMIPKKLRDLFRLGCAGFHASLLPQLRGGAPLNWAILLDFKETGVSFFEFSDGVDDGLLYAQEKFPIKKSDYIGDLIKKSENSIIKMLEDTLPKIENKHSLTYPQKGEPSYCGQRTPADSKINWNQSAEDILRLIRASSRPYSGAYSFLDTEKIIIWEATISKVKIYGSPGQIIICEKGVHIVCGKGALLVKNYQDNVKLDRCNHRRFQ